jgi:hypothetical protein
MEPLSFDYWALLGIGDRRAGGAVRLLADEAAD